MGEQRISRGQDPTKLREFMRRLLGDLEALGEMLERGLFETGKRRVGAEQELFLVGSDWGPATVAMEMLEHLPEAFTTELGRFNLEFNLDPLELGGDCLSRMEKDIDDHLEMARDAARPHGADALLTGILPTLDKEDLSLENMTPRPRYHALNDALSSLRGGEFEFHIKGSDELLVKHDNVMLEACNTSFQVHFQVGPGEFARLYNIAQVVAAPVLAVAVNSPLLFGKRLWRETRIALFQQSVDTRFTGPHVREQSPRVSFGLDWVDDSVVEIFQEDIVRFRVLLGLEGGSEDPFEDLAAGRPPRLSALRLHNGTIYRWNRPCYGVTDGKPHLRIENRVLPAGPTVLDEVANAAFWFGLIRGMDDTCPRVREVMEFDHAKENFLAAARLGLAAQFFWPPGRDSLPARNLVLEELLPLAREGLDHLGIDPDDRDRYLDVIEERVESGKTGATWIIGSLSEMRGQGSQAERLAAVTAASMTRQREGRPGHLWEPARLDEAGGWHRHNARVGQFMTTDLFTVNQDEVVDLVACLMDWEHIRHVPVEDNEHRLVGLVTHRTLLKLMAQGRPQASETIPVSEVMHTEIVTVTPETPTLEAIRIMKTRKVGCLPVLRGDRLVGIVTERDFLLLSGQLLESQLREAQRQAESEREASAKAVRRRAEAAGAAEPDGAGRERRPVEEAERTGSGS